MLKITKNIKEANLITHSGTFHPDDVFSTMFLSKIIKNPIVCRTNEPELASKDAIIYDIGYGKFDHHGPDAKWRTEKIKYCSFGLLWKEYGNEYLNQIKTEDKEALFTGIEEKLIMQIDAIDNGYFPKIEAEYKLTDLDHIIDLFNKAWNEDVDNDNNFIEATKIAEIIFDRMIEKINAKITANKMLEKEIPKVKDNILFLEEFMPYSEAIFESKLPEAKEIKVVITPSNRGGYNIKPMTINKDSKELIVNYPKELRGLHNEDLINASGIKGARFIHISGFISASEDLDSAYEMAKLLLENRE
ncbi:MAG: MYG1 family protein [Candidatus Coprovivens sp.]